MKVITQFESVWDEKLERYVTVSEESIEYEGEVAECKGGGGGGKGAIGMIVAVVATVYTAGAASGLLFAEGTAANAIASGAIGGAVGGGAGAAVSGGDIGKGILMGGVMGGVGGGIMNGLGATSTVGPTGMVDGQLSTGTINLADSSVRASGMPNGTSSWGASPDAGLSSSTTGANSFDTALNNMSANGTDSMTSSFGQTPNAGRLNNLFSPDMANNTSFQTGNPGVLGAATSTTLGLDTSAAGPQMQAPVSAGQRGLGAIDKTFGTSLADSGGAAASPGGASGAAKTDWTGAGLKLGAQAIGQMAQAPGSADMKSYLEQQQRMEADTQAYNKAMADKKAGVGDTLATNAAAMNPDYYATQQQNAAKNRDSAAWDEQEKRMRAQGMDPAAIAAERARSGVTSSQNQATSYDAGYQTGVGNQNATYNAAAADYTQVGQPTAGMASAYQANNAADNKAKTAAGNSIEQAFGVVNDTTKKAKEPA